MMVMLKVHCHHECLCNSFNFLTFLPLLHVMNCDGVFDNIFGVHHKWFSHLSLCKLHKKMVVQGGDDHDGNDDGNVNGP